MVSKEFDPVPLQTARIMWRCRRQIRSWLTLAAVKSRNRHDPALLEARSILGGKHFPPFPLWHGAPTSMACSTFDPLPCRPLRP